jgi:hypothetical protein
MATSGTPGSWALTVASRPLRGPRLLAAGSALLLLACAAVAPAASAKPKGVPGKSPVVTATATTLTYAMGDPPTVVDPGLTVTDPDDLDLEGATVRFSAGFESGDSLVFVDQNGISGVHHANGRRLDLSGTATVADYQAALRSIAYHHTGPVSSASKKVEFVADDGKYESFPVTRNINVLAANPQPVVTTACGPVGYTAGDPAITIAPALTVTDANDTNLNWAEVRLSSGFDAGDEIVFTDQNGISGAYIGNGTWRLSGASSVANYQTALRSVEFRTTGTVTMPSKTVEFTVNDGHATSDPATCDIHVITANQGPVVTTQCSTVNYTVGEPATTIDPALTVTDADDDDLDSSVVRISSGFEAGDELDFSPPDGIHGSYDSGTGELTLTGTAPVADYRAALRSVQYRRTGSATITSKTVEFKVNDGDVDSAAATCAISVFSANQAPVVTTTATSLTYTVGDPAVTIDPGVTVSDADDANLEGAVVRLSAGLEVGDELVFVDQSGISGVYDTGTGVLTLTGTATVAIYQAVLRSIGFRHAGSVANTSKTVEFTVNDADVDSAPATRDITVFP